MKMNKKELIKTLKPYWEKQINLYYGYSIKLHNLQVEMNKEIKCKYPLEFFFVDGEIVGIGAKNWEDRKHFKLIFDTELDE